MVQLEGASVSPDTTDISGPTLLSNVPNRPGGLLRALDATGRQSVVCPGPDGGPYRVRLVCLGLGDGRG